MINKWYALDRKEDVTGISGTGTIAFVLELDNGILMFWDTVIKDHATNTIEWLPSTERLLDIHGHDGATVLTPLAAHQTAHARKLMRRTIGDLMFTMGDLVEVMADEYAAA